MTHHLLLLFRVHQGNHVSTITTVNQLKELENQQYPLQVKYVNYAVYHRDGEPLYTNGVVDQTKTNWFTYPMISRTILLKSKKRLSLELVQCVMKEVFSPHK